MKIMHFLCRLVAVLALTASSTAMALADDYGLLVSFKTDYYNQSGAANEFTLVIAGKAGEYIDVDCGFGGVEYELQEGSFDETGALTGTIVSCQVSSAGEVKIYGNKGIIDCFNGDGCYITDITFHDPEPLMFLSLNHNALERLDLTGLNNLQACYLSDNACDKEALIIGGNKPLLSILDISIIGNLSPSFNLSDFPGMVSFDAMNTRTLTSIDPSGCPELVRLSIDDTGVSTVDVSQNSKLRILNVSGSYVSSLDLSKAAALEELYIGGRFGKFSEIDVSACPNLFYLFAQNNNLTSIDVSKNTHLNHLWVHYNKLTSIDLSNNTELASVNLSKNYFDFNTLPLEGENWTEYEYNQNALPVPAEYLVNSDLDLSSHVIRPDSKTWATVFAMSEDDPLNPTELDESQFEFSEDGKLKIKEVIADSVYVAYANEKFPYYDLKTTKFKVKSAEDYGKPDRKFTFTPAASGSKVTMSVGIEGASATTPKEFYIDFGDGNMQAFQATSVTMPDVPNVNVTPSATGLAKLYVNQGDILTALAVDNTALANADVTAMKQLRQLRMTGTELNGLDLQWNRCLTSLQLNGNHFESFSLTGNNVSYGKNVLTYVDLSNNEISDFKNVENVGALQHFDLSHNNIETINFTDCDAMQYIDVSYNKFTALKVNYCGELKYLNASNNMIDSYIEPETNVLEYLNLSSNKFTYATLPDALAMGDNYVYAPQAKIELSPKAPGVDLSAQVVTVGDKSTVLTWKKATGETLVKDVDYTEEGGKVHFLNYDLGEVYCELSHEAYPQFSGEKVLCTTNILPSSTPTNLVAKFVTAKDGQTVALSLASTLEKSTIFIDWHGDGTGLEEYDLSKTYTTYTATTVAGREVKVYSYDPEDYVRVFSVSNATLNSFDGSNMKYVTCLTLDGTGLTNDQIILPKTDVTELSIQHAALTSFDPSIYPNLTCLRLSYNQIASIDISACQKLFEVAVESNKLTEFKADNNTWLCNLYLGANELESIDLNEVSGVQQLNLYKNKLSSISLAPLTYPMMVSIEANNFKLSTLPLDLKSSCYMFYYGNQPNLDVQIVNKQVDLSSEYMIDGYETEYRWWVGKPTLNTDGELEGEELFKDDEYFLENGVTTFALEVDLDNLVCTMQNERFPKLILYTNPVNYSGINDVNTDPNNAPAVYYNLQGQRIDNPAKGSIVIRHQGNTVTKEVVK